mmetsp:Transcript_26382/g.39143  ORF Transcript_26382/g.39143 Transcript_26382/m.39143 type:complete len:164 (+) Transcript_26382:126-617(+)
MFCASICCKHDSSIKKSIVCASNEVYAYNDDASVVINKVIELSLTSDKSVTTTTAEVSHIPSIEVPLHYPYVEPKDVVDYSSYLEYETDESGCTDYVDHCSTKATVTSQSFPSMQQSSKTGSLQYVKRWVSVKVLRKTDVWGIRPYNEHIEDSPIYSINDYCV